MNLCDIAQVLGFNSTCDDPFLGLSIDSRTIQPGMLFVALRGEKVDGHDYVAEAVRLGAAAVVCERAISEISGVVQWVVPSCLQALADIATWYRQQYPCPAIAVTGSNGKTSVKEMIAQILPKPSFATIGNLNNHIGVPLSILQLRPEHRYAVFELGASKQGDIAYTVSMLKPQVAVINNIAPAHMEGFGSLDGVAHAKGEIYEGLGDAGIAVVNDDDDYAHFWDKHIADLGVVRCSRTHPANIWASNIELKNGGCAQFQLHFPEQSAVVSLKVPGLHAVSNALVAAACTYAIGMNLSQIVVGLESFVGVPGRMAIYKGKQDATIIDDSYNANVRSTLTAVDVLANRQGTRILVLGDMAELGKWGEAHHKEVGVAARKHGIDGVLAYGPLSAITVQAFGSGGKHYLNQQELAEDLLGRLDANTTVLVKGSRSAAMENIVQQLI